MSTRTEITPSMPGRIGWHLRDSADRSWLVGGSAVPPVAWPGFGEQASGDDDRVGQCDESVDDSDAPLSADVELAETSVVLGIGAFHDPSLSGLQWLAFGADDPVAAESGQ